MKNGSSARMPTQMSSSWSAMSSALMTVINCEAVRETAMRWSGAVLGAISSTARAAAPGARAASGLGCTSGAAPDPCVDCVIAMGCCSDGTLAWRPGVGMRVGGMGDAAWY